MCHSVTVGLGVGTTGLHVARRVCRCAGRRHVTAWRLMA